MKIKISQLENNKVLSEVEAATANGITGGIIRGTISFPLADDDPFKIWLDGFIDDDGNIVLPTNLDLTNP